LYGFEPKQRRAPAQRPGEIIDAALALFVEKGFAATRLDDVALRAGLSKAAIYLYFETRRALPGRRAPGRGGQSRHRRSDAESPSRAGGGVAARILEFMAGRIDQSPIAAVAKLVISESRAFPEIGRFYLKEVIGRGLPLLEGLIVRGMEQGEFRLVDPAMTVRSIVGAMLLAGIWRTVFERSAPTSSISRRSPPPRRPDVARVEARPRGDVMKRLFARLPKRAIFVAIAALLATLLVTRGSWQQPVLSILGIAGEGDRYLGYVEGETSLMAPPVAGQLSSARSTAAAGSRRATACSSSIPRLPRLRSPVLRRRWPSPRHGTRIF